MSTAALTLLRPLPAAPPPLVFPVADGARWQESFAPDHPEQELHAPRLRPLLACFDGAIAVRRTPGRTGCRLSLSGERGWRAEYDNVDDAVAAGIHDGARVRAGQPIGAIGDGGDRCRFALYGPDGAINAAPALRGARIQPAPYRISGTVLAVFPGQGEAVVKVASLTNPSGKTLTFDPPRAKRLLLGETPPLALTRGARVQADGADQGRGRPLKVERLTVAEPAPQSPAKPEALPERRVLEDFEAGVCAPWHLTGDAWGASPDEMRLGVRPTRGVDGAGFLSSAHPRPGERHADSGAGIALSPPFTLTHTRLRFRIGGGNYPGECSLNLLVDGRVVRSATGNDADALEEAEWDVADLVGRSARLQVVDARRVGPRGYLMVDQIEMIGLPDDAPTPAPAPATPPLSDETPAVTLADGTRVEGRRLLTLEATGYGPGENGRWGDRTKLGTKVGYGTVAVDPRVIPLGARLWVEGYGFCIALDVGSAIKGKRIDLGHDDDVTANLYGRRKVRVLVLD